MILSLNIFFKHQSEYAKAYTQDSVNNKISDVFITNLRGVLQSPKVKLADSVYLVMKEKVKGSGFAGAEKVIFTTDLQWLQMRGTTRNSSTWHLKAWINIMQTITICSAILPGSFHR